MRQISDVCRSEKREKMMFAHRVKRNVPNQYHLSVLHMKARTQLFSRILVQPRENFRIHACDAGWRIDKAFPIRIFSDRFQDGAYGLFDASHIDPRLVQRENRLLLVIGVNMRRCHYVTSLSDPCICGRSFVEDMPNGRSFVTIRLANSLHHCPEIEQCYTIRPTA